MNIGLITARVSKIGTLEHSRNKISTHKCIDLDSDGEILLLNSFVLPLERVKGISSLIIIMGSGIVVTFHFMFLMTMTCCLASK